MDVSGDDDRVATLSKLYLTVIGIIMESLKNAKINEKATRYGRTDGLIYRKTFAFINVEYLN